MAVIIGDYQYDNFVLGTCTPTVVDKTKTSYANVPTSIVYNGNTYYIRSLKSCFEGCSNLVTPPSLPPEVGTMERCFYGCSSMTTPPVIPNGANNLSYCFYGCSSLATPPDLSPTTVDQIYSVNLNYCFYGCTSLTQAPAIPSVVTTMIECFRDCALLVTPPDMTGATSVTDMSGCFRGCGALATPPVIPASVTTMQDCFGQCYELATPPVIPASVTSLKNCFRSCFALTTPPIIPSGVQDIEGAFQFCSSLTSAPAIPASVTRMRNCFAGCSSLAGNIKVYNSGINSYWYDYVLASVRNDIYIINGAGTSAVESMWKSIASGYSNVHYEADDNPVPSLSFTVTRVGGMASETPAENGEYAFIKATAVIYDTLIPDGWAAEYDEDESTTKDGTTATPYWTRTNVGNTYTLKCWFSLNDTTKHTFTLQVSDSVIDQYDNVKATKLSTIITQVLPKAYKLVDYYHDPDTDTEGMSIGKFATDANLLDVDMPALFRDTATMGEAIIDEPYFSLDTTAQSGTDHDLYSAITALGWQNDVIV